MTEIGSIIRGKREELGLTLAEVSEKTKISMIHLVAIENGDMDHFKHDMVFLRFYLKTISVALDLDFETIAHQFNLSKDDYTNTISLKKIKENETSEANVVKNRQLSDSKYIYQNIKKRRVRFLHHPLDRDRGDRHRVGVRVFQQRSSAIDPRPRTHLSAGR